MNPAQAYFPGGLDEMKATAERIRAAGLKPGIHTLTACISPNDPWVTPVPSPHLIASNRYTLAKPLSATDKTIFVNEMPAEGHDVIWSYSGNGNALRVGSELIRYAAISREQPYAFLECERGALQTQAAAHPEGAAVDYLQQRYIAFYPDPKSPLADELAERIARVYNACKLEMIYFDGSEGMRSRFGIDAMRWAIFKRLHGGLTEGSEWGHNSWWIHSRLGAWDHPVWAMKQFHDAHIRQASRFRLTDLLEPQLGWWAPRGPSAIARGHFPDELEYFAAQNLAIDGPGSIQGVHAANRPANARIEELFTVLGWYERLRLARYFDQIHVAAGRPAGPRRSSAAERCRPVAVHPGPSGQTSHQRGGQRLGAVGDREPVCRPTAPRGWKPCIAWRPMMTPRPRCWPTSPISMRWTTAATRPGSPPASNWRLRTSRPAVAACGSTPPTPATVRAALGRRSAGPTSTPISACCPATPWACGSKATAAARC